jgi:hypothetical protein
LKFFFIALGAVYAMPGFLIGAFQEYEQRAATWKELRSRIGRAVLLVIFAAISGYFLWFSLHAFWTHPSLLQDLVAKLFDAIS